MSLFLNSYFFLVGKILGVDCPPPPVPTAMSCLDIAEVNTLHPSSMCRHNDLSVSPMRFAVEIEISRLLKIEP